MKKMSSPTPDTMLHDIHRKLVAFPNIFRDKVNEECSWSTPTYYRKMRNELPHALLSNAEREKIIAILNEALADLITYFERYRKK